MAHAWKACWVHALAGSNPASSAAVSSENARRPQTRPRAFAWAVSVGRQDSHDQLTVLDGGWTTRMRRACGMKRVTYPTRSVLTSAQGGGHLLERDRPFHALGLGFVSQLVEPCILGALRDLTHTQALLDVDHRVQPRSCTAHRPGEPGATTDDQQPADQHRGHDEQHHSEGDGAGGTAQVQDERGLHTGSAYGTAPVRHCLEHPEFPHWHQPTGPFGRRSEKVVGSAHRGGPDREHGMERVVESGPLGHSGGTVTVTGIITAIIIGAIIGFLGRLVAPGKQNIPIWLTIVVGIVAAFIGTWIAGLFGVADTGGIDWIELVMQVIVAAIGVAIVAGVYGRRGVRR
jgi:uncharacterized membrane protein YeaQ/YmgE (transglycosylase-associated protein family)